MSSTLYMAVQCRLVRRLPAWLYGYLEGLAGDPPVRSAPDIPDDHAWVKDFGDGALPDGEWFTGPWATVTFHDGPLDHIDFRLHGSFHDEAVAWQYALLKLLAHWSLDDCLACTWSWFGEGDQPKVSVWYAHDRRLFSGVSGDRPVSVDAHRDPIPLSDTHHRPIDAGELQAFGLSEHRAGVLVEAGPEVPVLGRWLLARRLWRAAVEEPGYADLGPNPTAQEVAAIAVEHVLRALDEGRDPDAPGSSPGWRLVETSPRSGRNWPRAIEGLADHIDDL